jgi:ribonucleoside-diphosphate reductase alpha chain
MRLSDIILRDKYYLKEVDFSGNKIIVEDTPNELWERLDRGFGDKKLFNGKRFYDYFKDWKIVLQGSPMAFIGNPYQTGSLSNCVVIESPNDDYEDILRADAQLVYLMANRCGVGLDLSKIRPKGSKVNNPSNISPGVTLFAERYSNTTREVASEGRRGALMLTLDCRHPDILDFISMKDDLTKVTGANVSVMMRNELWDLYDNDPENDYILRFPVDSIVPDIELPYNELVFNEGSYYKRVQVKDIVDSIIYYAWKNGEPGIINIDIQRLYSPSECYYPITTTNPCSEIAMGDNDCCRLLFTNLFSCIKVDSNNNISFDFKLLCELVEVAIETGDYLIDLEVESLTKLVNKYKDSNPNKTAIFQKLIDQAVRGRRLGHGISGLADVLAWLGMDYGDQRSKGFVEMIMDLKLSVELETEIKLAQKYGAFPDWNAETDYQDSLIEGSFLHFIRTNYPFYWEKMQIYGRRHCSWSTIAPTGSTSIVAEISAGSQALFKCYYIRRTKVLTGAEYDFIDAVGDKWKNHYIIHPKLVDLVKIKYGVDLEAITDQTELDKYINLTKYSTSTADKLNPVDAVAIQGILQKYTTHSISSTINLPETATEEDVRAVYYQAYRTGCKGITVNNYTRLNVVTH